MSIPVFKPLIEEQELSAVYKATEEAWFGSGKYVGEFEKKIQQLVGCDQRWYVAVNTGTSAIHVALCLAGVGPGDEVITPSFNFCGVAQAVVWVGAEPVFCEIRADSLCLDTGSLNGLISPKTKAIISLDFAFNFADHEEISRICDENGLRHIHDAAHSFLWEKDGKKVGSFSDICTFSFDPVKVFTCIDAGVIVVSKDEEESLARNLRMLGQQWDHKTLYQNQRPATLDVRNPGYRYHLSNVHAAIGLAQLEKAETIADTRRFAFNQMSSAFKGLPGIWAPEPVSNNVIPFIYVLRISNGLREKFQERLKDLGVDTSVHWQPIHTFTMFKEYRSDDLKITEKVGTEIVTLPLHSKMSNEDLERVILSVKKVSETLTD